MAGMTPMNHFYTQWEGYVDDGDTAICVGLGHDQCHACRRYQLMAESDPKAEAFLVDPCPESSWGACPMYVKPLKPKVK